MSRLSPLHYRLCVAELHTAMGQAHLTDDWAPVARLIDDWEATAHVDASPELAKALLGNDEFEDYQ